MVRSVNKGPYMNKDLLTNKMLVRLESRNHFILPSLVNQHFELFNGRLFMGFKVCESMVSHKLGEFVVTKGKKKKTKLKRLR